MQNKIKDKSASNVMDATGYWREFPERDLEHVRRYPVTVERLDEKDVWKDKYMKVLCVLPELNGTDKSDYIVMLQKELARQAKENYVKSFCVEELIIWVTSSQYDEADYLGVLHFVQKNFTCKDGINEKVVKDEFKDIELWNCEEPILGAGLGAAGFIKGYDYFNLEDMSLYSEKINKNQYPMEKAYFVSAQEMLRRTIRQGIYRGKLVLEEFHTRHGFCFEEVYEDELVQLAEKGYLRVEEKECVFLQKDREIEILDSLVK